MDNNILSDVLADCLDRLESGASIDDCLARYPQHAAQLRRLLRVAEQFVILPASSLSLAQMAAIESHLLQNVKSPRTRLPLGQIMAGIAAAIILVIGIVMILPTIGKEDDGVLSEVLPTASITASPVSTATITANSTNSPTEEILPDDSEIPIPISLSGKVTSVNEDSIIIEDITITDLPDDLTILLDMELTIDGTISEDGTVRAENILPLEEDSFPALICETENCHPILTIYAQSFDVPYEELDALFQSGYGIGEIGRLYLLSETSGTDVLEIQEMREEGISWGQILQSYPDLDPSDLAPGKVISNRPPGVGNGRPDNPGNGKNKDNGNGRPDNPGSRGQGNDK